MREQQLCLLNDISFVAWVLAFVAYLTAQHFHASSVLMAILGAMVIVSVPTWALTTHKLRKVRAEKAKS